MSNSSDLDTFYTPTPTTTGAIQPEALDRPADSLKQKWVTQLTAQEEGRVAQVAQGNAAADDTYRARLSQKLQPWMHDEMLQLSEQLILFANIFFSRFHSLLPVMHVPSFKPTTVNSLLFVSICLVWQPLSSWESILAHSCSDALSMVQVAIIGQTFAILSGRPKNLVLADILHGTVMAWARESNKNALLIPASLERMDPNGADVDEQWNRWIDQEQRRRVEIALNIHDAELSNLMHHESIRRHRRN
ncbi:hypothetical protein BDV12DRAFT_195740 [Aspergillus spectabilis]